MVGAMSKFWHDRGPKWSMIRFATGFVIGYVIVWALIHHG